MPKTLTENERTYIKKRLLEEAQVCMKQFGVRRTTVDELVKRAGISKGTFYLFYESKELLLFDVFRTYHQEVHADLMKQLEKLTEPVSTPQVTELLFYVYRKIEDSFLYELITSGDLELLMRRLPPEAVIEHEALDNLSIETFIRLVPGMKPENIGTYSAAFRAVFLSMLYKREIGVDVFDDALKILLHGVVVQMFGEASL